jgi:hypothetical protein
MTYLLLRYNKEPLQVPADKLVAVFPHSVGLIEIKVLNDDNERISEIGHTLIKK